jgi:hypothetical protein
MLGCVFSLAVSVAAFAAADFPVLNFDGVGKFDANPNTKVTLTPEHATEGKNALKVECGDKDWPGIFVYGFPADWTGVKYLAVDVFNPGTKAVELCGWLKDDPKGGFYGRYNYQGLMAEPGQTTLRLWLGNAIKGNAFPLNRKNIVGFCMGPNEGQPACTLYFDNFRLEPVTDEKLPDVLPILDFEEGSKAGKWELEDWPAEKPGKSKTELVAARGTGGLVATSGTSLALKCTFRAEGGGNLQVFGFFPDWGSHDYLVFDCFNDAGEVVELMGWFRDRPGATYYNRYNYSGVMVRPGKNEVRFPLAGMLKGESAGSGPTREALDRTHIVRFNLGTNGGKTPAVLTFDHFRLEKSPLEKFEGGRIRKFDFGKNIALTFPGFTPVNHQTAYDPAYGYGWKGKLAAEVQCGSYEYPNDLLSDFVPGHELDVDLPNGKYRVLFWAESANYWEPVEAYHDRKVAANGKTVVEDKWTGERYMKERFFRHAHDEDLPGDDHWEKYVVPRWTPFTFDVEVTDGHLVMQFDDPKNFESQYPSKDWPLNAMIICPVEDAAKADAWMKKLEAEEKRLFRLQYNELATGPDRSGQLASEKQPAVPGDYAVFVPDYFKDVYPASVPTAQELAVKEIALRAAPGQFEAAALGIFPNKDLGKTTVTAGELKSADGRVLPAGTVEAHKVRYKIMRRDTGNRFVYSVIPRMVDPENFADVKPGVTRTFHLIAHVPADAAPGVYRGTATVTPEKGKPSTMPIAVEVLPFKLVEDRDFDLAFFGLGIDFASAYPDTKPLAEDATRRNLKNLRDHGMTTTWGPGYAGYYNGKVNMQEVERFVKLYRDAGFDGNMFVAYGCGQIYGADTREKIVDAYTQFTKRLAELGRTKLMLSLADEPSKGEEGSVHEPYTKTIERLKLYKDVPGLMTSGYYSGIEELIPWFEVSILGGHNEAFVKKVKAAGKRCWVYGAGAKRFSFGFYAAKLKEAGVEGMVAWHYGTAQGDAFNSLDGREEDHAMAWCLPDGMINAVIFDRVREGVDDFRYLTTLRTLAQQKKDSPAAAEAKKLIDEILANMTVGRPGGFNDSTDAAATDRKCAEYRARMIEAILKLK